MSDASVAIIMPAGGSGSRFGASQNKIFASLAAKPVWWHAVHTLCQTEHVHSLSIALSASDEKVFRDQLREYGDGSVETPSIHGVRIRIVRGGEERYQSVQAGLQGIQDDPKVDLVAVHDAARPLLTTGDWHAVLAAAARSGAAMLATPLAGSLKRSLADGHNCRNVDRRDLWIALTPQVFKRDWIAQAYTRHRGFPVTDDAQLLEACGHPVELVRGSAANLKITYPEDLRVAEAMLQNHG
ncbi:MAG: 2-C-methyl-D-erythritol 4-phosphate cytidylyltransferase [Planctomycetota bacterium]